MSSAQQHVPITKRLVLVNSLCTIATRIFTVVVFAWVIQHLLKRIPEGEMAQLPVVMSIAMALPLVQVLLNAGLARHVTEAYARGDLRRVTRIVSSQFPLLLAGAVVVTAVGGAAVYRIDLLLDIPPSQLLQMQFMLWLIIGQFSIGMVLSAFTSGLYANQRFIVQNAIEVGASLLRIALLLGLILGVGAAVHWVIVAQVVSRLAAQLSTAMLSVRLMPALRFQANCFSWEISKETLAFGGWYFLLEMSNLIRRGLDAPLLYILSTPLAVNTFFLGSFVEQRLRDLTAVSTHPLLPVLTAMHAHGQKERLASVFLRGGRILLWGSLAAAVPLMLLSRDLYVLYLGEKYSEHADAATVLVILLLGFPLTYSSHMLSRIVNATGQLRPLALRTLGGQLVNLLFTLLLVGVLKMGAIGAALATFIYMILVFPLMHWPLALRMLDIPWRRFVFQTLVPGMLPPAVRLSLVELC